MENNLDYEQLICIKPYVIGLFVLRMRSVFGIVDARGNILCYDTVKTIDYAEPISFVFDICDRLQPMIDKCGGIGNIKAMGIGAASGNNLSGNIEDAANLHWKGNVNLASMFKCRLGIAVTLGNDATVAAIGEMVYGAARGMKNFLCVMMNSGLGAGVVCDGLIVAGHKGIVGELGHVLISPDGRLCNCGNKGCLEAYVSRRGVLQTALELMEQTDMPSELRNYDPQELTLYHIAEVAERGDKLALETLQQTGKLLGKAMAGWVSLLGPEAVVMVGELADLCGKYMIRTVVAEMNEVIFPLLRGKTKVLLSCLDKQEAELLYSSAFAWGTNDYDMFL